MNRILRKEIIFLFLLLSALQVHAELACVTGKNSPLTSMSIDTAKDVFLKKIDSVDGHKVVPLDLSKDDPIRKEFYRKIANKSPDQILSYWSRLIFTGREMPPQVVSGVEELAFLLSRHPELIGYIPEDQVTEEMKVVLIIK